MNRIAYNFRQLVKICVPLIAKIGGVKLLNKKDSIRRLAIAQVFQDEGSVRELPGVTYWGGKAADLDKPYRIEKAPASVFCYQANMQEVTILSYGGIKINQEVLDLDFGNSRFLNTMLNSDKRPEVQVENCICLWSHLWGGYYDFLLFIYAKLVRIKSVIGEQEFSKSVIVYPLFGTSFEQELFAYLGFSGDRLLDAGKFNVKAKKYFFGNNDSFYGQNKGDIKLIRHTILELFDPPANSNELLYMARSGRRKLMNEPEVLDVLSGFGFTIIEDKPRPVCEQISIFRSARLIIGPHGASFTNILWSNPKAVLIELFSGGYYPPYFRYLANVLELDYYALVESHTSKTHHSKVDADIYIDPELLKKAVAWVLKKHFPEHQNEKRLC